MLVAVGLNRTLATEDDRERLTLSQAELAPALSAWAALDGVEEVAVLDTAHRLEIYAAARFPSVAAGALRGALSARAGRELPLFEQHGPRAFGHLIRVAASLESALLGEPRILRQVEGAFSHAARLGVAGAELATVLDRTRVAVARIQAETALGAADASWGLATAVLAGKVLGPLAGRRALVLGAGELARLAARHLSSQGARLVVLNRTPGRAVALADELGGRGGGLDALPSELGDADLVVMAAPLASPALAPAAVERLVRARRRPLVLVDLAVPRVIPVACGALPDVYLCDADDLDRVMRAEDAGRGAAVAAAERIAAEEVARFSGAQAWRGAGTAGAGPRAAGRGARSGATAGDASH